jgi:carboxylate-amine ligase
VERYEAGWRPRPPPATLAQENKWRATRYGLSAGILDLVAGDSRVISVVDSIRRTLDDLSPHARELGSVDALDGVRRIISAGNGAERQLAAFRRTADIRSVTRTIVGETQGRSIRAEA